MTGTPDAPPLVVAGSRLTNLKPVLLLVTRLRWLLCVVGAAEGIATISGTTVQPPDLVHFAAVGGLIVRGRLDQVYDTSWMQAGPFELLGSWALFPFEHQHAKTYVIEGPEQQFWLRLISGAVVVVVAMLGTRYLRSAHGLPRSGPAELLAGLAVVIVSLPYSFWMGGHLSQVAVPMMWVWGASLAVRGRNAAAGVVLGLSAGWEPWGVLAAGVLLTGRRIRPLAVSGVTFAAATLACYLPFLLAGRFEMFHLDWVIRAQTVIHTLFPGLTEFTWPFRMLQGACAGLAGAAAAWSLRRRRDLIWLGPLAVVLARLILDPLLLPYYWQPFMVLVVVGAGLLHPGCSPARAGLVAGLVVIPHIQTRYMDDVGLRMLTLALGLLVLLVVAVRRDEPAARPEAARRSPSALADA